MFFLFVIFLVGFQLIQKKRISSEEHIGKKYGFLQDEGKHIAVILQLLSVIIKSDEKITDSELRYIEEALDENFNQGKTQAYMSKLKNVYLEKELSHKALAKFICHEYDNITRIQILHLVIGIATADGLLTSKEYAILKEVALTMRIPFRAFESILGMFHFRKEWEKQSHDRIIRRSSFSLDLAFQILGLEKTASIKEIKKAYRKLAVKHHPDKVIHMGVEYQKAAKEKFQKISEAYEYIKDRKGFS